MTIDLFATYWRGAPPEVRTHVRTQTGWSLEQTPTDLAAEIKQRFVETWEWIAAEAYNFEPGVAAWKARAPAAIDCRL